LGTPAQCRAVGAEEQFGASFRAATRVPSGGSSMVGEPTETATVRIEASVGTIKADAKEVQSSAARIKTRLDRHEARIEALEARP